MKQKIESYKDTTIPRSAIMFNETYPGIALKGYYSSTAWRESDKAFSKVLGRSFGWFDLETKKEYTDDKRRFTPMSQEIWDKLSQEDKNLFFE